MAETRLPLLVGPGDSKGRQALQLLLVRLLALEPTVALAVPSCL